MQKDGTADNERWEMDGDAMIWDFRMRNLILKAEELGYGTLIMGIRDAEKISGDVCSYIPETELAGDWLGLIVLGEILE
ncbi:MAG: hypothetical protein ACLUTA_14055 [Blautia wexlerae]